jgi:hypothetical protein
MTLLDSASNKIKGLRDPEIVDPGINWDYLRDYQDEEIDPTKEDFDKPP